MANLLDVVNIGMPEARSLKQEQQSKFDAYNTFDSHLKWLAEQGADAKPVKERLFKENEDRLNALNWDVFWDQGTLPLTLASKASTNLSKLAKNPRTTMQQLMEVTQKLGFVILPFEYLNPASYAQEPRDMQEIIQNFGALEPDQLDIYVCCPAVHYGFEKHLAAQDPNKQMYISDACANAFMALRMTIPTLRTMKAQIAGMEKNQKILAANQREMHAALQDLAANQRTMMATLEENTRNVSFQLEQMGQQIASRLEEKSNDAIQRLKDLKAQVPMSEEAKAKADAIMEKLRAGGNGKLSDIQMAEEALSKLTFELLEPLMFAVKKGAKITDRNTIAYIGPCWGPDFADIIAVSQGLTINSAQRKQMASTTMQLWGRGGSGGYGSGPGQLVQNRLRQIGTHRGIVVYADNVGNVFNAEGKAVVDSYGNQLTEQRYHQLYPRY